MLLPFLLFYLFDAGIAFDCDQKHLTLHQSDVLKLKCDALPMRTIYSEGTCYYTYTEKFTAAEGLKKCQESFKDATLFTEKTPILEQLGGKQADFHDSDDCTDQKRALCAYELGSKCDGDETLIVNAYCVHTSEDRNYNDGLKYCRERKSTFPSIENLDQNLLLAGELSSKRIRSGWLLQKTLKAGAAMKWTFPQTEEKIEYFAQLGGAPPSTCKVEEGMVIHSLSRQCSTFGAWRFYDLAKKNTTLCIRSADSDYNPGGRSSDNPGPEPGTPPIGGKDEGPTNDILVPLKYFYNAFHIRHAFCANAACMHYTNKKDIGFSPTFKKAGSLGRIVHQWSTGMKKMETLCPNSYKKLVPLYFRKEGKRYVADFANGHTGIQGYVAREGGVCGANVPIREWKCSQSQDYMYGQDLKWNTWYRNGVRHGGKPWFWIWK